MKQLIMHCLNTNKSFCIDKVFQGWQRAERAEPRAGSREPSHILLPLARLVGIWSWRAEPRASHYKGSARLAVKPPRLARSWLARTARRAYTCNIHFVRFS